MKALIDPQTNTIHGIYQEPLNFDISGHYVIDIPQLINGVVPSDDSSVSDLIGAKNGAWLTFSGIANGLVIYDELLAVPNVNSSGISNGITFAPNKRTVIQPGGSLYTHAINITSGVYTIFLHYSGFVLYRSLVNMATPTSPTQGPSQMLYGYNPDSSEFELFSNDTFTVTIVGVNSPYSEISTPVPDGNYPGQSLPSSFRLKFVNNAPIAYHLSDWILIYG
jgi:hypothetical protein